MQPNPMQWRTADGGRRVVYGRQPVVPKDLQLPDGPVFTRSLQPRSIRHHPSTIRHAFTLIEILIVVTIIGIIGAIVVPQMLRGGTLAVQAAGRIVIADLLYAQNEAIAMQQPREVIFSPATNSYRVADQNGNTLYVGWMPGKPGTGNYVVDFNTDNRFTGVTMQNVQFGTGTTITFNALGVPDTGGSLDVVSGTTRYRITVTPFTGRVTISSVMGG